MYGSAARASANFSTFSQLNPRATSVRWGALVKRSMWHYGNLCKTTKLWGPRCSFQLAVDHHAWHNWKQLLSCLLELLSLAMVTPRVCISTCTGSAHHWISLEGTRPKLVFYPLRIFIYDSLNFGTAFHNSFQEQCLIEVSTCIYFYTTMQVSASDPAFSSFVQAIKVSKVKRKSLAAGWNY